MIRTIYIRIVLLFICVVFFSLAVGFFTANNLYSNRFLNSFEEELLEDGKRIGNLYERASAAKLNEFLTAVAELENYDILVVKQNGDSVFFGGREREAQPSVPQQAVARVLQGGIYRGLTETDHKPGPGSGVGLPFQTKEERLAMFLFPNLKDELGIFRTVMLTVLTIVLALGSLLFLFAAHYMVRPIQALTDATRRLAKGDFDTRVPVSGTHELGTLARSFNTMAGELKQLDKLRQDFISNVSHEFQSPLTSIRGFAKALLDNELPEHLRTSYLTIISNESERLSRLTDNLLRLASLDRERVQLHLKRFKLDDQLMRVVISQEPQWQQKKLAVEMELPELSVVADQDLLWHVWANVFANAVRFTPEGGRITITLREEQERAIVTIADTGVGIAEEHLPRIFDRFYTVDKSRERTKEGSGLGLAIVHRIVTLHDGEITVHSSTGEGTVFQIFIPRNVTTDS